MALDLSQIKHILIDETGVSPGIENYALVTTFLKTLEVYDSVPAESGLIAARRHYFETAIQRGTDLSNLNARHLAQMTARHLDTATQNLPDKLSNDSRTSFSEAAAKRPAAVRWGDLFPAGRDEIYLSLAEEAQSLDERIATFIERHNQKAQMLHEQAAAVEDKAEDRNARKSGEQRQPQIDQRQIQRDPNNPSQLLTYNSAKQKWEIGPRLGSFLYARGEWGLADDFQIENGRSIADSTVTNVRPASLKDLAHHQDVSADELSPQSLMIVLSRDEKKIGEMSSGQRWTSCMAEGGLNFRYVAKDIEAGTLVAYVVSRDDPEARYPLMRVLLKPYRNKQGETILIPGKVYPAAGAGRTGEGFLTSLKDFARVLSTGKSGIFNMDHRLYADGQPKIASVGDVDTPETLRLSLRQYHDNTLHDLTVDLQDRTTRIAAAELLSTDVTRLFVDDFPKIRDLVQGINDNSYVHSDYIDRAWTKSGKLFSNDDFADLVSALASFDGNPSEHDRAITSFMATARRNALEILQSFPSIHERREQVDLTLVMIEENLRALSQIAAPDTVQGFQRKAILASSVRNSFPGDDDKRMVYFMDGSWGDVSAPHRVLESLHAELLRRADAAHPGMLTIIENNRTRLRDLSNALEPDLAHIDELMRTKADNPDVKPASRSALDSATEHYAKYAIAIDGYVIPPDAMVEVRSFLSVLSEDQLRALTEKMRTCIHEMGIARAAMQEPQRVLDKFIANHPANIPDNGQAILDAPNLDRLRREQKDIGRRIRNLQYPEQLAHSYFRLMRKTAIGILPPPLLIPPLAEELVAEIYPKAAGEKQKNPEKSRPSSSRPSAQRDRPARVYSMT